MDEKSAQQIFSLAGSRYAHILTNLNNQNRNRVKRLLSNRQMPERGWNNSQILQLLSEIASLDQNNLESNVGVGDREGRVFSSLVASRSYQMAHGMGRSGDIIANQPKALGSSIIVHLTNILAKSLVKTCCGIQCKDCFVLPVATGMALSLTLKAIYKLRPSSSKTKCALWCRVDQKTCFKAIIFSGFKPIVVENVLDGDQVISNVAAIETLISSYLHRTDYSIDCVVTVTSCFAPRAPDSIIEISRLCEKFNIAHVVNNAFGLQSTSICSLINRASKSGRLDAVVQSTDKNIMVPVGGSIVATFKTGLKEEISMCYPGRASISPLLDTCITLLSMGQNSWKRLVSEREENLHKVAISYGEKLLDTGSNPISLAMSLCHLKTENITFLGAMLFRRGISGCRLVDLKQNITIEGHEFEQYGSHCNSFPFPYLICSCAIGIQQDDIDEFCARLSEVMRDVRKM